MRNSVGLKKVFVGGNVMSGKNILRKLLDGHPKLLCNHIHDMMGIFVYSEQAKQFFFRKRNQSYLSIQPFLPCVSIQFTSEDKALVDIGDFFYALYSFSDYKSLHKLAAGETLYIKSKEGFMERHPFLFDFRGFEKTLQDSLFSDERTLSQEEVMDAVYLSYEENWMNKQYHEKDFSFVDTLPNGIEPISRIASNLPHARIIVMVRDPISLLFANAVRIRSYANDKINIDYLFRKVIFTQEKFIQKIRSFKKDLTALQERHDNVFVADFERVVLDTENAMREVSRFIGIEYREILSKPSICGELIEETKHPIIGEINDDPQRFLGRNDIELLNYLFYGFDRNKMLFENASLFAQAVRWRYINRLKRLLRGLLETILPQSFFLRLKKVYTRNY